MKRNQFFLTLLGVATFSLTTLAQSSDAPYLIKTFSGNIKAVRAETSGGSLSVEGGTDANAKVEMYVRANNWNDRLDKAEIEDRLKDYDITIAQEGSTIVATAKHRGNNTNWKKTLSIGFKFYTPRNIATDLRTSGGSINIDHCRKNIELQTSGGSIEAKASSGTMRLHTSGGSIRLVDLNGTIDAQTSGGSVNGDNIEGNLRAGTSGGSMRLTNVSGSIDASTSAGGMDVSITKLSGPIRLTTSAGNVNVRMPLDKGINLSLSGNRIRIPLNNFSGDTERDHIRGTLNGGGIPVTLSASSGSVNVNQ